MTQLSNFTKYHFMFFNDASFSRYPQNFFFNKIYFTNCYNRLYFAAAILIILNQAKSILGIEIYDSNTPGFIQTTIHIIKFATKVCPASIFLSISTTIIFILLQKYFKALPNVALTLFFGSLIGVQLTN